MRILLIGDISLQNDAIAKVLRSQDGWTVQQVSPAELADLSSNSQTSYTLSLLDLSSLKDGYEEALQALRKNGFAGHVIALYNDHSEQLITNLLDAGVDDCLSINSETSVFVQRITALTER